jgi:hypothetical protein
LRDCVFCGDRANTREDVWPEWIMQRLDSPRPTAFFGFAGKQDRYWSGNKLRLKARFVCKGCNSGWMSQLESANIPLIGSLMHGITTPLDSVQQWTISLWAVKTSMVMEYSSHRNIFFTPQERSALRETSTLPPFTGVWLGRYSGQYQIGHFGVEVWDGVPENPKTIHGYVNTIVVGRLAIQAITFHVPPEKSNLTLKLPHRGIWAGRLEQILPRERPIVSWPPNIFISNVAPFSLDEFIHRWSFGLALPRD